MTNLHKLDDELYYVYEHRLDGEVIYVGKGKDKRAYLDERNVYWDIRVGDRREEVEIVIVGHFMLEENAFLFEQLLIRKRISEGHELCNIRHNEYVHTHFDKDIVEKTKREKEKLKIKEREKREVERLVRETLNGKTVEQRLMESEKKTGAIERNLGKVLTRECRDSISQELNVKRPEGGRIYKWPTIEKVIKSNGYNIEEKRIRVSGRQMRVRIITKESNS